MITETWLDDTIPTKAFIAPELIFVNIIVLGRGYMLLGPIWFHRTKFRNTNPSDHASPEFVIHRNYPSTFSILFAIVYRRPEKSSCKISWRFILLHNHKVHQGNLTVILTSRCYVTKFVPFLNTFGVRKNEFELLTKSTKNAWCKKYYNYPLSSFHNNIIKELIFKSFWKFYLKKVKDSI